MNAKDVRIVAFLQNQWFRDPERVKKIIAMTVADEAERGGKDAEAVREFYIASFLFMGCLTGRRLQEALGEELCDQIVWEECSREIGGQASSKFPPDPDHIHAVLRRHNPHIVLAFGSVATPAVTAAVLKTNIKWLVCGPHPAARFGNIPAALRDMRGSIERRICEVVSEGDSQAVGGAP